MTEDMQDLLFLGHSTGDVVGSPVSDHIPERRASKERALKKGWIVFMQRMKINDGNEADVFFITEAGNARLQELGGRERVSALGKKPN